MATRRESRGTAEVRAERNRKSNRAAAGPGSERKGSPRRPGQRVIIIEEKKTGTGLWVLIGIVITLLLLVGGLVIYDIVSKPGTTQQSQVDLSQLEAQVQANPNDIAGLLRLGHAYVDDGGAQKDPGARNQMFTKAQETYQSALKLQANNVDALTHLGVSYFYLGETDKAIAQYDKALAIDPSYAHALFDKANAQRYGNNDYAGAIKTWETFLKQVPADSQDAQNVKAYIEE